jgi:C-terminal processing protease CtpA/Prc
LLACITTLTATAQTPQQLENAKAFTKLYGYVRYFHPSDEAATINWNQLAIYGSQKVSNSKDQKELQANLLALFKPLAPSIQILPAQQKATINKETLQAPGSGYEVIAWQHSGVDASGRGELYQSLRTNRPAPASKAAAPTFAPINASLDAVPLQGKEFKFKAKVRMVNGEGQGQLWARVDRSDKKMGFFDNMQDRPIKNKQWQTYEIKGTVDKEGAFLVFGIMLNGTGEVAFDDISLQVKEGDAWKELYKESFTDSKSDELPKGLNFAKTIQGYYNYAVKKSEDATESFAVIKSSDDTSKNRTHISLFAAQPKVGEYIEKPIGGGLKVLLPIALYGTKMQTFPVGDTSAMQRLKQHLATLPTSFLTGDSLSTRLGNIAIAWNIFQHFYPYFDVVKTDWEADLKESITKAYADKTAADFHKTLQLLTAKLKDGHVRVSMSSNKAVYYPLIRWEWVEDELVITHVADSTTTLKRGDIVKQINDQPAKDYFAAVYPTISAGTKGWLEYRAQMESLNGEKGSVLKLNIVGSNNQPAVVSLARNTHASQYYAAVPKKDTIKMLAPGIAYINLDKAPMEAIDKALPELEKSRVIICDLRGYPNGNHGLLAYLLKQNDTSSRWMQVAQTIYPDREKPAGWQYHSWGMKPADKHLNANIIFLIDGQAISYAESYMGFVEHYKLATIIGQPTAGANGNVNPFTLPGGYYISWTGMRVVKHDGSTHHTVGIQPHVTVNKTIKGVREGKDEYLEKALEVAGKPL